MATIFTTNFDPHLSPNEAVITFKEALNNALKEVEGNIWIIPDAVIKSGNASVTSIDIIVSG